MSEEVCEVDVRLDLVNWIISFLFLMSNSSVVASRFGCEFQMDMKTDHNIMT